MKLVSIALLACLGLVAAASLSQVKIADKSFLEKQKFLFEIVYRVEDNLMFEEWVKQGDAFIVDKFFYDHYDSHMEKFVEAYKMGALLPRGEFFGALVKTHHKQAWGLFNFFYYAKDWETFRHNACWARIHCNEGMFVYALTLAVIHRDDFQGLILPSIYEIFPQYFFNSKFVYEAEKFDYDVWSKYIMYEKEFHDVYYKNNSYYGQGDYVYIKDWKMWQWWKLMGLEERWYTEDAFMLRENIYEFNQDEKWNSMLKDVKVWWMPVDYTRDVDFYNKESTLSYFTEDLGWNSFWYYLNMDHSFFLDGKTFGLDKDRRGEFWVYNIQKLLARYYMERLSHGFGEIIEFSGASEIEHGYNPQLISYNGQGFSYRQNYYDFKSVNTNLDIFHRFRNGLRRINDVIELGYYKMEDGTIVDLRKPDAVEHIGNMLQGNIDVFDKYFFNYFYMLCHMYASQVDYDDVAINPSVFSNFETMMRDPMFYMLHKKISKVFFRFKKYLEPYTKEELMFHGVQINDVRVSELATFFDLVDFDVTNLLNENMLFEDGKFVWDKTLLARQMRLNHKPFTFEFTIESDKAQKAVIRIFLAPKYDEFGRLISLVDNRENFFTFDKFVVDLTAGKNVFTHNSDQFYWTAKDRTTYTELYHYVMMAYDGKYDFPLDISEPHCLFPHRLILPHGWKEGMPMRMFFIISPYEASHDQFYNFDATYSCGYGSGSRFTDNRPLFYPFDREINEFEFFVPNMLYRDVKIYHYDNFEKYMDHDYKMHGSFDYSFSDEYYTKGIKY